MGAVRKYGSIVAAVFASVVAVKSCTDAIVPDDDQPNTTFTERWAEDAMEETVAIPKGIWNWFTKASDGVSVEGVVDKVFDAGDKAVETGDRVIKRVDENLDQRGINLDGKTGDPVKDCIMDSECFEQGIYPD